MPTWKIMLGIQGLSVLISLAAIFVYMFKPGGDEQ